MNIKELIEKLKKFDETLEVKLTDDGWAIYPLEKIEKNEKSIILH